MKTEQRCANCDAVIPEDGRFCIECGHPVNAPATGATTRISELSGGPRCPSCGTVNPAGARFCVTCGSTLDPLDRPAAAPLAPSTPSTPPAPSTPRPVRRNTAAWGGASAGVFLIGLGVLAVTGWWWPGILVLIGISSLLASAGAGQPLAGLQSAVWLFGIAFLAVTGWWWPGILFLVGLSLLFSTVLRPGRR